MTRRWSGRLCNKDIKLRLEDDNAPNSKVREGADRRAPQGAKGDALLCVRTLVG
jgi:hypothetical protein